MPRSFSIIIAPVTKLVRVPRPIVSFYEGSGTDHAGRRLADILAWPDARLEAVHDYIQWLFPLPEPSPVNPLAPVLDAGTIAEFARRQELRARLRASLERMLRFYGLTLREGPAVERAPDFARAAARWLTPGNHNHLRITRILRCYSLLGRAAEARAFHQALKEIAREHPGAVTERSLQFWRNAVSEPG
jgi:hypothetical protein